MIASVWKWLSTPSAKLAVGVLLVAGVCAGAVGMVAFDGVMHATSTDEFCLACHELEVNIGVDYETRSHALNANGIHVTCSDCHLPKPLVPKYMRKLRAVGEVYHHVIGTIDTPEKFEAHRMTMAMRVWTEMNETDSRECRDCHHADVWDLDLQTEKARRYHGPSMSRGKTCIDCHKGVAHILPSGVTADAKLEGIDD